MKGAIFLALNEMIETQFGIQQWEALLDAAQPASEGIYTSTMNYDDGEMILLCQLAAKQLQLPLEDFIRKFGCFLFTELNRRYPVFTQLNQDFFRFLHSIENVIHKEVRKLYENPGLPSLECKTVSETELHMSYRSPRKICYLAEGLIYGAAEHYAKQIRIDHDVCMHQGHDHCQLVVHVQA